MDTTKTKNYVTIRVPRLRFITTQTITPRKIPPERPPPPKINQNDTHTDIQRPYASTCLQPTPLAFLNKPPLPPKPTSLNYQPPPLPPKPRRPCSTCGISPTSPGPIAPYQNPAPPRPRSITGNSKDGELPVNQFRNLSILRSPSSPGECLNCRDFSFVDRHAENFPRRCVTTLQSLAHNLTNGFPSKTDKARTIFIWLHHNISYDTDSFFGGTVRSKTPEKTLQSGLAVCQGYAELFEILARYSGLEAIVISGHGKGWGYQEGEQFEINHAWNGVRLESNNWHLIDPCWGAGHLNNQQKYVKELNTSYFTSSPEQFGKDHFPSNPMHQFFSRQVLWNEYLLRVGPVVYPDLWNKGFSKESVQPRSRVIHPGRTIFVIEAKCEHISVPPEEQYVLLLAINETMIPFEVESGKIWSCVASIKPGSEVRVCCLSELNGKDAKGIGVQTYKKTSWGSKKFGTFCKWDVVN